LSLFFLSLSLSALVISSMCDGLSTLIELCIIVCLC
jgi:hypothetical protein